MHVCIWASAILPLKKVPGRLAPLLGFLKDDMEGPASVFDQRILCVFFLLLYLLSLVSNEVLSPLLLSLEMLFIP